MEVGCRPSPEGEYQQAVEAAGDAVIFRWPGVPHLFAKYPIRRLHLPLQGQYYNQPVPYPPTQGLAKVS